MSYDALETSISGSTAIRLYDFSRSFLHYRYTSADRDITWLGELYTAIAISDEGKVESGEAAQETFTVDAPIDFEIAALFNVVPPSQKILLTVTDIHQGDAAAEVFWTGQVSKVTRPYGKVQLACEHIISAMRVVGLTLGWQRSCPYSTYDSECGANKEAQRVRGTLTAVTATTISAAEFAAKPDGFFDGGILEWTDADGIIERRMIVSHVGDTLTLLISAFPLAPDAAVSAFPVCDNTPDTCNGKLANIPNYGGAPGLPGKSPFINSPFA